MRWWLGMVLACGLALGGAGSAGAKEPVTVWFMEQSVGVGKRQAAAVARFEAAHPEIDIQVVVIPYSEFRDKLLISARGGSPPDVSVVDQIWNPEFAAAGFVAPLDEVLARSKATRKEDFFEGAWESAVWRDKVYGIPYSVGIWMLLYYNREMFRAAGLDPDRPPATWDETLQVARRLTRDTDGDGKLDQWGFGLFAHKGEDTVVVFDALTFSAGGSVLDPSMTRANLSGQPATRALEFLLALREVSPEGALARSQFDISKLFTSGKVAMQFTGAWEQDTVRERAPDLDWDFARMPIPKDGRHVPCYGGWNLAIYQASQHKEAAWKFIEYWTSAEVNGEVVDLDAANIESAKRYLPMRRRGPEIIFEQLSLAHPRPISPVYAQVAEVQQDLVQGVMLGTPIAQALREADERINEILGGY